MSYPPGITLRPVTIGGATVLESGEQLSLVAEIRSSRSLMWGATGWQFHAVPRTITGSGGEELTFSLPVTDLTSWRLLDNPGSVIDVSAPGSYSHSYTVKLTTVQGGRPVAVRTIGPFVLPAEDLSPVDLDLMLPVGTVAGGAVLVPDSWGARVAAAVAAAEAAVTAVEDAITAGEEVFATAAQGVIAEQASVSAVAPRLTTSPVIHKTGTGFRWASQADETYVTFLSFYHVYYTAYKTTGAVYAISRPLVGGILQHVWRSTDGGENWTKLFELPISQATGVWYENVFVEPYYETVYLQKTTTGFNTPYSGVVESYTNAGVLIGSRAIGDSRWLSGSHSIDYCPNSQHVVIFGEYASDTQSTVNLWRTTNKGLTWTSVLAEPGNNGGVAGAVRHFHAVAADPYTKHWWAASGDADGQSRIYRSTNDGLTWNILFQGTQHERTTSFVFTADHVYYGTDYPASTPDHSKLVRINKTDLTRTDVATIKDGFPVWALTKTFSPEGILIWPSCEFASNTRQDYVTVQWYDFATEELVDVARFTIKNYATGTEGIHNASRHQDVATGNILFTPTTNVQRQGGFGTSIVSAFSRARLVLPSA